MRTDIATQRIRGLERRLERFDEREVAAVGRRVQAAICVDSPIDSYEQALVVTLKVLNSRLRAERKSARLAQARHLVTQFNDPLGIAAGGLYACVGCHYLHSALGHIMMFEPEAA